MQKVVIRLARFPFLDQLVRRPGAEPRGSRELIFLKNAKLPLRLLKYHYLKFHRRSTQLFTKINVKNYNFFLYFHKIRKRDLKKKTTKKSRFPESKNEKENGRNSIRKRYLKKFYQFFNIINYFT